MQRLIDPLYDADTERFSAEFCTTEQDLDPCKPFIVRNDVLITERHFL